MHSGPNGHLGNCRGLPSREYKLRINKQEIEGCYKHPTIQGPISSTKPTFALAIQTGYPYDRALCNAIHVVSCMHAPSGIS